MIIEITEEHIKKANLRRDEKCFLRSENCPIAIALTEMLGEQVAIGFITWHFPNHPNPSFQLESYISDKITKWDDTGIMEPFSFVIEDGIGQ